jgi:hypothetical protein
VQVEVRSLVLWLVSLEMPPAASSRRPDAVLCLGVVDRWGRPISAGSSVCVAGPDQQQPSRPSLGSDFVFLLFFFIDLCIDSKMDIS